MATGYESVADFLALGGGDVDKARFRPYLLAGETANVKRYGAVGDGVTDDSAAFQAAHDALSAGDVFEIPGGVYLVNDLLWTKSQILIRCIGRLHIHDSSASASIIKIGDKDNLVRQLRGNLRLGTTSGNFTAFGAAVIKGLEVVNLQNSHLLVEACGLTYGLALHPAAATGSARVANCRFFLDRIDGNQFGVHIDPKDANCWVNENTFDGGQFTQSLGSLSDSDALSAVQIQITNGNGNVPNNNLFFHPSFEGKAKLYDDNGVNNHVIDARVEPNSNASITKIIEYRSASRRCSFQAGYTTSALINAALSMEHTGTITHVDESIFTIDSDVRAWCYPGAVIQVTVTGNVAHTVTVARSTFAGGTTTIQVAQPIFSASTAEAIGMRTAKIADSGRGNSVTLPNTPISGGVTSDAQMERHYEKMIALMRSALTIQGIAANYPALTLLASASSAADPVLRVMSTTGDSRLTLDGSGNLVTGGLTPRLNAANSIGSTSLRYINLYLSGFISLGDNIMIRFGEADPEGSVVGFGGSLYFRYDSGNTVYTAYLKKTASGNTGWEEITTS